jgi:hypothetical protein
MFSFKILIEVGATQKRKTCPCFGKLSLRGSSWGYFAICGAGFAFLRFCVFNYLLLLYFFLFHCMGGRNINEFITTMIAE